MACLEKTHQKGFAQPKDWLVPLDETAQISAPIKTSICSSLLLQENLRNSSHAAHPQSQKVSP